MEKSLDQWEQFLAQFFRRIKLLGEIPLTRAQVHAIGEEIRATLKRRGLSRGTRELDEYYPRTFITYLALMAAHNTERNYWGVITQALGVHEQAPSQQEWGALFLRKLDDFGLPLFEEVESYKYVAPIRLHGGIPAYSLPDYFEKILMPAIEQRRYDELPTAELIGAMLERSEVQLFVDSPARNFIEFGGTQAHAFVEETRKMARYYRVHHELPAPDELDLPPYVMQTFRQFMEDELPNRPTGRIRNPYITLDPYAPEFYLHLPAQQVLLKETADRRYVWQIDRRDGGRSVTEEQPVRLFQPGYNPETEALDQPLQTAIPYLDIRFGFRQDVDEGDLGKFELIREWRLNILPTREQAPLRAFDPKTGQLIQWTQILPAQDLWLLYPMSAELQAEGARLREVFDQLWGAWSEWQVQGWDLTRSSILHLIENGSEICAPIPIFGHSLDPYLDGGRTLLHHLPAGDTQFYVGSPPVLRLPVRTGRPLQDELAAWGLRVLSRWAASPALDHSYPHLLALFDHTAREGDFFTIPLSAILGEAPAGSYELRLSGPGGTVSEFRFHIWPGVDIPGLAPIYFPEAGRPASVDFKIRIPDGDQITAQPAAQSVTVSRAGDMFQITAGPEVSRVPLFLTRPVPGGEPVRISVTLGIPRLRWTIPQGLQEDRITWTTSVLSRSLDEFLGAEHKALRVEIPLATDHPLVISLRLNLGSDDVDQISKQTYIVKPHQTHLRFPLEGFTDTLRQHPDSPVVYFELAVLDEATNETAYIPVYELRRKLEVRAVAIQHLDELSFQLTWEEPRVFRNRQVRIWSAWQPWVLPITIDIPDEARGELIVREIGLPPARYLVEFSAASLWQKDRSDQPGPDVQEIDTASPEERVARIREQLDEFPALAFQLHFELACIYHSRELIVERDQEMNWLFLNLESAPLNLVYVFYRWLLTRDPSTSKAVRIRMYRRDFLKRLFAKHETDADLLDRYLEEARQITMLSPDSARFLIEQDVSPEVTSNAIQRLIKRADAWVTREIVRRIEIGALSEEDAILLLAENPAFALEGLGELSSTEIRTRLLREILPLAPGQVRFVMTEFWIGTDAGWGKITSIADADTRTPLPMFDPRTQNPILEVVLRPNSRPEPIEVDLGRKQLQFEGAANVFVCARADCCFITGNLSELRHRHNRAAHSGVGATFRQESPKQKLRRSIRFSHQQPEDEWVLEG